MRKNNFNYEKIRGAKKECPACHKMIGTTAFTRHVKSCKIEKVYKYKEENCKIICALCGKEFHDKRSAGQHYSYCSGAKIIWNRGLDKETDERIKKLGQTISIKTLGVKKGPMSYEKKLGLKGKTGGYRKGSGRGKSGYYKGYWCDSTWELAYVIYNLEHNIDFKRNYEGFKYFYNGEFHRYYPDFIENDIFIEIKGYFIEKDNYKINALIDANKKYIIISKNNGIEKYLEYATYKYGIDLIKLYHGDIEAEVGGSEPPGGTNI